MLMFNEQIVEFCIVNLEIYIYHLGSRSQWLTELSLWLIIITIIMMAIMVIKILVIN